MVSTTGILRTCLVRIELAREIGAIERMREEEPQRADDAVHGRRRDARLLLLDLELPDILGARGVGRTPQPGREPSDVAQIVTLRLLREAAHGHVVDQPLAQRADRANLDKLVHRSTPQLKESKGSACGSPTFNQVRRSLGRFTSRLAPIRGAVRAPASPGPRS
jgi:hypothetical protein